MMALLVWNPYRFEMRGQAKAPAIPDAVAVMESRAIAIVPIRSSVRANKIAVPDTVATASDRRNHAIKNIPVCRRRAAVFTVFQTDDQAKIKYCKAVGKRLLRILLVFSDGPGRLRSQRAPGIVRTAQNNPTRKSTQRKGVDSEAKLAFFRRTNRTMLRIWTQTAAAYPRPTPFEEIWTESLSCVDCVSCCCSWCWTFGWFAASSGRNEFSKTKVDPRDTTPMTTSTEARRYHRGITRINAAVAAAPVNAKPNSNCFRCTPVSNRINKPV